MACECHADRVLTRVELEQMQQVTRSCCQVLPSVRELETGAIPERVYVFVVTHRLPVLLQVEDPQLVGVGDG